MRTNALAYLNLSKQTAIGYTNFQTLLFAQISIKRE